MARGSLGTTQGYIRSLFEMGVSSNLTDGQLLERFASCQDETAEPAFAALVERHGPAVLRVCRAILRDEHDAEDAFQATFLVLMKKGGSLWVRDSLGPWLHRVACRAAGRVKEDAQRRKTVERHHSELLAGHTGHGDRDDLAAVLHNEIDRLPDRYRMPIVLCDIEGATYAEAARRLGWSVATVKGRLSRGRERLRRCLSRSGLASPSRLWVVGLPADSTATAMSPVLARSTVKTAMGMAAKGTAAAGTISAPVAALVKGVLATMALTNLKSGLILVTLTLAAVTATALVQAQQSAGGRRAQMGPDRRAATAHMLPAPEGEPRPSGPPGGSGFTFDQVKPEIEEVLKKHGSAKLTTLAGIEVSVRFYDKQEVARAKPLLEQVLLLGPFDLRGPADPPSTDEDGTPGQGERARAKQRARQLLAGARRDLQSGELAEAARKLAEARALDVKWGLFDDTPDKVAEALLRARGQ